MKWFKGVGEFVGDYTMKVGNETITAEYIFIVSGLQGQNSKPQRLKRRALLDERHRFGVAVAARKASIILGGGYVGVEYAHFFSGIGTKTTLIQRPLKLLKEEEPEVSDLLKVELQKRVDIYTGYEAEEVRQEDNEKIVVAKNLTDGSLREFRAEALMVATGRQPNSDLLKPERTGVKLDELGYIKVNEYLETGKKNIWAFGDAIGKYMFKHVANYEAGIAWHNSVHDHKAEVDYSAVPHAVFSEPQVASVGLKEAEAKQQGHKILVGTALYKDTAMGAAMAFPGGLCESHRGTGNGKILGAHLSDPEASILIQEVINAMNTDDRSYLPIVRSMHIHPAMPEVVQKAFENLQTRVKQLTSPAKKLYVPTVKLF